MAVFFFFFFFFSSRRRHTRFDCDWSSDVCSSDLLLVLRDLTRDEQEPPAARLGAVGVADGSRERRRVVELDPLRHGLLPSRTIVSPLVAASSSRVETAAATSAGSMSRPPGLIRAMARTASSNDLPVFAAMLRAAVH